MVDYANNEFGADRSAKFHNAAIKLTARDSEVV